MGWVRWALAISDGSGATVRDGSVMSCWHLDPPPCSGGIYTIHEPTAERIADLSERTAAGYGNLCAACGQEARRRRQGDGHAITAPSASDGTRAGEGVEA